MSDESNNPWTSTGSPGDTPIHPEPAATEGRVGFCQDCGKPLTQATIRNVGTGVFCEPCLAARVGTPNPTPGYTTVPPYATVPPTPVTMPSEPSPGLAALLGLIPGVGAMYNGQFAKGIAHIAIFAILVSLSDNVNGIFGLFVAGWILYMAFEAHHTAVARRDGLPLPNAFGLNDIGERLGFGKGWGNVASARPNSGAATPPSPPETTPGYVPVTPVSPTPAPDWVGYVPPTAFGTAAAQQNPYAATMAANLQAQAMRDAGYPPQSPYAQTYTGSASVPEYVVLPIAPTPVPEVPTRRFPTGALWLIGLGILILLANLLPDWQYSERWWLPVLFVGLSAWTFTRRLHSGAKLICIIRWPLLFLIVAIMLALHALNFEVTVGLTLSILLIAFGGLLLLERTAGASPTDAAPYTASVVPAYTPPDESPRAAWSATPNASPQPDAPTEENQ